MNKNFYEILGITDAEKNLSESEFQKVLKTKYKKLAREWHPDKFATKTDAERQEAEEKFKEITEAYNVLSDPDKKHQYDFGGSNNFNPWDDIDPFSFFHNMRGGNRQQVSKGRDIEVVVNISLEESYNGGEKEIKYNRLRNCGHCNGTGSENGKVETCPHCNGTGIITQQIARGNFMSIHQSPCPHCNGTGKKITNPCAHCNGTGMENIESTEKITIPRGVNTNNYFVVQGKGCEAQRIKNAQCVDGNLIVIFNVHESNFKREGNDLVKTIELDIYDGLLGCDYTVTAIDGKDITIKIPECCNFGHIFTIKGKGMPEMNNNKKFGDMKIIVHYKMPKSLSKSDKETIKSLKK